MSIAMSSSVTASEFTTNMNVFGTATTPESGDAGTSTSNKCTIVVVHEMCTIIVLIYSYKEYIITLLIAYILLLF